jgi:hypothetical protein
MIPKLIHVFWSGDRSWFVDACISRMREVNPGWRVIEYSDFVEADHVEGFERLSIQAKTDWLRLCLVQRHGGVWLDATILCNHPIEESLDVTEQRVVGFECPIGEGILENWAFGAVPNHPLILAWKAEFASAIRVGFDAYKQECGLKGSAIYDHMPYLTMHGAYVVVARRHPDSVSMKSSMDEKHGPFYFTKDEWETGGSWRLYAVFKLFVYDFEYPPLLKFTGETRGYVLWMARLFPILPFSFLARTTHHTPSPRLYLHTYNLLLLSIMSILVHVTWRTSRR